MLPELPGVFFVGAQRALEPFECVAHTTFHRVFTRAGHVCDFAKTQATDFAQQKHLALIVWQTVHRLHDGLTHLTASGAAFDTGARMRIANLFRDRRVVGAARRVVEGLQWASLLTPA